LTASLTIEAKNFLKSIVKKSESLMCKIWWKKFEKERINKI
jgi:hypothetical protein